MLEASMDREMEEGIKYCYINLKTNLNLNLKRMKVPIFERETGEVIRCYWNKTKLNYVNQREGQRLTGKRKTT